MTTTIEDRHKYSTSRRCCQTKKLQRYGTHSVDPSAMQHKKPAMQDFVRDKISTREHIVSGTGATLWSLILNVCKVGGPGVATQWHQTGFRTARIPKHLPPLSSDHLSIRYSEIDLCFSSLLFPLPAAKRKKHKINMSKRLLPLIIPYQKD